MNKSFLGGAVSIYIIFNYYQGLLREPYVFCLTFKS